MNGVLHSDSRGRSSPIRRTPFAQMVILAEPPPALVSSELFRSVASPHHPHLTRTRWRRRSPPSPPPPRSAWAAAASATATGSSRRSVPTLPLPQLILPPSPPLHAGSRRPRRLLAVSPARSPPPRPRPYPSPRRSKSLLRLHSPSSPAFRPARRREIVV